jgi:phage I-like protein
MDFILAVLKEVNGAPDEFQVLPEGKIEINGDEPIYLDEEGAQKIISFFKQRGLDMVIDYEHQTLTDEQAPAAGWIKQIAWKGKEGLWVLVEWTKKAKEYLTNREYRYFSPVLLADSERKIFKLINVALTNTPAINNLEPIVAKLNFEQINKEDLSMKKLKELLGLAADAAEEKITEAVQLLVNKVKTLEAAPPVIACKELLEAMGAKPDAGKDEAIAIIASLKAPGDIAAKLSLQVADLTKQITEMKQNDLITLALKEGKTSPKELDDWGRDLAKTNPDQFTKIILSRPVGSVIPVETIIVAKDTDTVVTDAAQAEVNRQMGIDQDTFEKYNKKQV